MENRKTRKDKYKTDKKKRKKVIIISVILVLIGILSAFATVFFTQLGKMKTTELSKKPEELGINKEIQDKIQQLDPENEVTNIALFGVDRRSEDEASRSDAIMIASIDKKHKKIKLTSIMRDTYVSVPGRGKTKITHAYAYGGPQLAIRTLNENFQLNIKDYVTVDFFSLIKIIDTLGGVEIDVNKEELKYINNYIDEMSGIMKVTPKHVTKTGKQPLNGTQAVAYTRIRYTAGGDYERTERQRKVLTALFDKIQNAGVTKYPSLVSTLLPFTETSINKMDLVSMGTGVLTSGVRTLDQERFPVDGYGKGQTISGVWYLVTDLTATADQMHKYIYEDVKPTAKK